MTVPAGPLPVTFPQTLRVAVPAVQPGTFKAVALANATPFLMAIDVGTDSRLIPPYTADVVNLNTSSSHNLVLVAEQAPGGPALASLQSYVALTFYGQDEDAPPGATPLPQPDTTTVDLAPGSTVDLAPGSTVDIGHPVDLSAGTAVGITGTPNVAVPGGVGITGTPNVGITGTPNVAVASGIPDVTTYATFAHQWDFNGWHALEGRSGAGFVLQNGGTFVGSVQMLASNDGGSTAYVIPFYDPATGAVSSSLVCGSGQSFNRVAVVPPGATHVGLQVLAYTSGSVLSALTLTDTTGHAVLYGNPNMAVSNTPNVGITGTPNVAVTSQANSASSGTFTALNQTVSLYVAGMPGVGISLLAGTMVGTVAAEVSPDGTNWTSAPIYDTSNNRLWGSGVPLGNPSSQFTGWVITPPGTIWVRLRTSSYTSGSVAAFLVGSSTPPPASVNLNTMSGASLPTNSATPKAATRNVDAASTATLTVTGLITSTLIAAPGAGKSLELHGGDVEVSFNTGATFGGLQVQLQRSDTNAAIWAGVRQDTSKAVNDSISLDFEGATLPANVGLNLATSGVGGGSSSLQATVNLNYTTTS